MIRKLSILGAVLVVGVVAAGGICWLVAPSPPELRLSGVVETHEVRLSSKVGGRIRKIMTREGAVVEAGTPLVAFDVPELEARREQIQASLKAAQAQLAKARNGPRAEEKAAAQATAAVARARLRRLEAGYRDEEVAVADADARAAEFEVARAQKEWDREARLRNVSASSAAQIDVAFASVSRLQEQAKSLRARHRMLVAGTRPEEIAEAEAEVARTKALADLCDEGTRPEEIAEAEARVAELYARLRELEVQLAEAVVVAPSTVRVETLPFRPGDTVAANQPVVRVLMADDLVVKAYIPEPQLGKVRLNQQVRVSIDSFPDRSFRGTITHIASVSEFSPRNIQTVDERHNQVFAFKVRLLECEQVFRSGMAAEVLLPLNLNPEQ